MAEQNMPATEAKSYEFAFHILPTVAEGEVPSTLSQIKAHITKAEGVIGDEETPERIDLVYPIEKHIEGKNRKFTSAYFGWIRFTMESDKVEAFLEEIQSETAVLRHLLVKLTKEEEANPFRYHEARKSLKMVETVGDEEVVADVAPVEVAEVTEDAVVAEVKVDGTEEVKAV